MGLQRLLAYTASPAKVLDQLFPRSLLPVHMSGWHPNTQGVHIPCYHAQVWGCAPHCCLLAQRTRPLPTGKILHLLSFPPQPEKGAS